ncbi:MAG: uberolysin/carnocyclin family circular bacteriocin, partial [Nocardioidaceae bacterium]
SQIVLKKKDGAVLISAVLMSVVGLTTVAIGALWVAGSLGISTAAASQIVAAIVAGGWALRAVIIVFGAGLIGAITATVLWYVSRKGRTAAIA